MSGTAFGTVVLHIAPEAVAGGTLNIIEDGDMITLDVPNRILHVALSDEEITRRKDKKKQTVRFEAKGLCAFIPETC